MKRSPLRALDPNQCPKPLCCDGIPSPAAGSVRCKDIGHEVFTDRIHQPLFHSDNAGIQISASGFADGFCQFQPVQLNQTPHVASTGVSSGTLRSLLNSVNATLRRPLWARTPERSLSDWSGSFRSSADRVLSRLKPPDSTYEAQS